MLASNNRTKFFCKCEMATAFLAQQEKNPNFFLGKVPPSQVIISLAWCCVVRTGR